MANIPPPPPGIGAPGIGAPGVGAPGVGAPGVGAGIPGINPSGGIPGVGLNFGSNGPPGVSFGSNGPAGLSLGSNGPGKPQSTTPGKKGLKGSAITTAKRSVTTGSIDLPLLAPTGPQSYVRNQNRQSPPPLPAPSLDIPAAPQIPANAPKVTVNPNLPEAIKAVIQSAPDGAEVIVPAGDYKESFKVNKSLHFLAQGNVRILSDSYIDDVKSSAPFVSFRGFTFIQPVSQSAGAAMVSKGTCLFENCSFKSEHMQTITVKNEARAFFRRCTIEGVDSAGLVCNGNSVTVCEETVFKAPKANGCLVRNNAIARFSKCVCEECARNSFLFMDNTQFVFENATITKNFEVQTQTKCGIIRNCNIQGPYLKISGSATPYILNCNFNNSGIECLGVSGVRLQGNTFIGNTEKPPLLIYGDSTVETHEDTVKQCRAGAAVAVYLNGEFKSNDGKYFDLAGVGFFTYGNSQIELNHSAIVNASNGGIVAHSDASVILNESLIDRVGSVGILLKKAKKAELRRSKVSHCALSGVEANNVFDVAVDHCIFDENTQCGFVGIQSTVNINESDFTSNKFAGIDVRDCKVTITKSISCYNQNGGIAFRNNSSGQVEGGGLGENGQFGVCVESSSFITINDAKFIGNANCAAYATIGGRLTLTGCNVTHHNGIAIESDGVESRVDIQKCELVNNGTAVQVNDGSTCDVSESKLFDNGTHIEVAENSHANVRDSSFQQSRNGIGIVVAENGNATIDKCEFSEEDKAAISNAGNTNIAGCTITECGICGIFWNGSRANGEISNSQILRNGSCGVQVMKGSASVVGNTIEGHTAFGIHIDKEANVTNSGNNFSQNSIKDVNNEL